MEQETESTEQAGSPSGATDATTAATTEQPLFRLVDVERTFSFGRSVVRAVDKVAFEIKAGEFVAIQGSSGSGKSTLLQLLGALEKPTAGQIYFCGQELSRSSDKQLTNLRAKEIGFIFQQFNLIPTLSAIDNIESAIIPLKRDSAFRRERSLSLLEEVGLSNRATHLPTLMSGGEQQRVAICRALANQPAVLLADEPTGNLDSTTAEEVIALLARLSKEHNMAVILVTHADEIAARAERRMFMKDGQISE